MTRRWPVFWGVVAIVFACFTPALRNRLLAWDDAGYILEDAHIRSLSWDTVRWAFTEFHCNYWAPLTWLSYALDHAIWGFEPIGYHLTNVLLHALSAGLFFLVSLRLLERRAGEVDAGPGLDPALAVSCAALAALLFGLHPLRVESVAWAAERKDVLSMALGLGAVLAWLAHARGDGPAGEGDASGGLRWTRAYALALVLLALSLLAKAAFVTLPFALLVLDWYPLRRLGRERRREALLEKVPMLLLAAAAAAVTSRAMAPTSKSLAEIDLGTRVLTAFTSIARYLRLTILPIGISPLYPHPGHATLGLAQALSIALVAGITAWAVHGVRRRPAVLAAWLLFLGTLFPVLGLTQNWNQELAARFTYVPSLALSLLAALGVAAVLGRPGLPPAWRRLGGLAVALLLALLSLGTVKEIAVWRDDLALWSRVIELEPHVFGYPYARRADARERAGDLRGALADVDEALAIAARKRFATIHEVYAQRARLRSAAGDREGAAADLRAALEASPEALRARYAAERDAP
jgi:hypothetical protein